MKKWFTNKSVFALFICLMLAVTAAACAKDGNTVRLYKEGLLDTINFGDSIVIDEYIETFEDAEISLTVSKGDYSEDLSTAVTWLAPEPGVYKLSYKVVMNKKTYSEDLSLTVKAPRASWTFDKVDLVYDLGTNIVFSEMLSHYNIEVTSYYSHQVKVKSVTVNSVKTDFADTDTGYTLTQRSEHKFTIGYVTEDGQESWSDFSVFVRYADAEAKKYFDDNNIETYGYISIENDKTVTLLGGSATYNGRYFQVSDMPYVAFKGNYGAGSFVEFEFKGKNLPQLAFFCDEVTPDLFDGNRGIYISNGTTVGTGVPFSETDSKRLTIYGTNKVGYKEFDDRGRYPVASFPGGAAAISHSRLDENVNYKYYVGFTNASTGAEGKVTLNILLINTDDGMEVFRHTQTLAAKEITKGAGDAAFSYPADYFSGSIVAYGKIGRTTEFKVTHLPYSGITSVDDIDQKSEFLETALTYAAIGQELSVSDYIATPAPQDYDLFYTDESGTKTNISGSTFSFATAGKYKLTYGDGTNRRVSISINVSADFDLAKLAYFKQNGITLNNPTAVSANGTVTLPASVYSGATTKYPYVAFNGANGEGYCDGYFVETDFYGKGMPHVLFFADKVTDSYTDKNNGILIANGFVDLNEKFLYGAGGLTVYAPKKAESGAVNGAGRLDIRGATQAAGVEKLACDVNYRLIIGITGAQTGTGADGKFTLHVLLVNLDDNSEVLRYKQELNLGSTTEATTSKTFENGYFKGSIVLYSPNWYGTSLKVSLPRSASSVDDIDVKAAFKNNAPSVVAIDQPLNVSDFVTMPKEGETYTFTYAKGANAATPVTGDFHFTEAGEYTLTYTVTKTSSGSTKTVKSAVTVAQGAVISISTSPDIFRYAYDATSRNMIFSEFLSQLTYSIYPNAASGAALSVLSVTKLGLGSEETINTKGQSSYAFDAAGDYKIEVGGTYNDIEFSSFITITVSAEADAATQSWMQANNVTVSGAKSILAGKVVEFDQVNLTTNNGIFPYVAFNATYADNTFLTLDFKGKVMPNIAFFVKEVTNSLTDGKQGMLFTSGFNIPGAPNDCNLYAYKVNNGYGGSAPYRNNVGGFALAGTYRLNEAVSADPTLSYRLIIGTSHTEAGKVTMHLALINLKTGATVQTTSTVVSNEAYTDAYFAGGGSIVIYGSSIGASKFSVEMPQTGKTLTELIAEAKLQAFKTDIASFAIANSTLNVSDYLDIPAGYNYDLSYAPASGGLSVAIEGTTFSIPQAGDYTLTCKIYRNETLFSKEFTQPISIVTQADYNSHTAWITDNSVTSYNAKYLFNGRVEFDKVAINNPSYAADKFSYISYGKNYLDGTYVCVDFEGKGMPNVTFFVKEITNSLSDGKQGMLFNSGFGPNDGGSGITLYKTKKVTGGYGGGNDRVYITGTGDAGAKNLSETGNYRLIIGTSGAKVGEVTVHVALIDLDTGIEVFAKTQTIADDNYVDGYFTGGGSIVLYGSSVAASNFIVYAPRTFNSLTDAIAAYPVTVA